MALKWLGRGQFCIKADSALEFLGYSFLRLRHWTGGHHRGLCRTVGGFDVHRNLAFHEYRHGFLVTDRAEGRLKLFTAIDKFFEVLTILCNAWNAAEKLHHVAQFFCLY